MAVPLLETFTLEGVKNGTLSDPLVIDKPAGTQDGDLLLALAMAGDNSTRKFNPATGWLLEDEATVSGSVPPKNLQIFSLLAGPSEPSSYSFPVTSTYVTGAIYLLRISGAESLATIPLVIEFATDGASGTASSPSITPTNDESLIIKSAGALRTNPGITSYSTSNQLSDATVYMRIALATSSSNASPTGTEAITYTPTWLSAPVFSHVVVAVAPPGGGGGGPSVPALNEGGLKGGLQSLSGGLS